MSQEVNEMKVYPLTHPQKRIWYNEKIHPDTSLHNIGGPVRIMGSVDFELLKKSIQYFIKRHEGVRLHIIEVDGEAKQYVSPYKNQGIDYFDFSSYQDSEAEFTAWVSKEAQKPFKLQDSDLYYFAVFKISDNENGYLAKFHHSVCDGWSIKIMTEEICSTYMKLLNNEQVQDGAEYTYINYIDSEQKYLSSERFIKNRKFWMDKFDSLPESFLCRSPETTAGNRKSFPVHDNMSSRIREYSVSRKCPINTFFIALMLIYLYKTTQQEDIVIGTPVLNRSGHREKSKVGMFTSTMPFRMEIRGQYSISCLMDDVNSELMHCYFHQKYPYDLMAQDLELKKKGYDNLFQICVNYYNTKLANELNGNPIRSTEFYSGNQVYSLQLVIKEWSDSGAFLLDIDYNTSAYSDEQITSMYSCLMNVAAQILDNDEMNLDDIGILTDIEYHKLIYQYNFTKAVYPHNKTIYELFEEQVEKSPRKIAIEFEDVKLTYKELNEKADRLASFLMAKGVKPDTIVGLLTTHSIETVVGILGILKAGGAYLPIDPEYPPERISFMLRDSGTGILLTNIVLDKTISFEVETINLGNDAIYSSSGCCPNNENNPGNLAYVIYTSGSTGTPKGVMIEHRGLVNYIWWAKQVYVRHTDEVFPLYSSIAFDLTVTSIFTPLISGNRIIIYSDNGTEFVLYRILRENRSSIIKLTPAHLSLLKDMDNRNSSIKRFIVGGEDLRVSLAASIYKSFGEGIEIFNEYGPTETVVGCMIHKFDYEKDRGASVPIGIPAHNVQIYILDRNLKPLPEGCIGEMFISGDGVARGYMNRKDLTAKKFIPNPFYSIENAELGRLMYKTGDLARHIGNGLIEYAGRADFQVKIRGYRIELGEIEKHILNYECIIDTVVVDYCNADGSKYLCAYITSSREIDESALRKYLSDFLPGYMIPSCFMILDKLPLTSNGKVNRNQLPEPHINKTDESCSDYVAPRDDMETRLVTVIKEILNCNRVGMRDNFIEIGGDSIKAIQVAAKLNNGGLKIKVKDILAHPLLEEMVAFIRDTGAQEQLEQKSCEGFIKSTPITSWFLSQNPRNINHWNQSVMIELKQSIDNGVLETAMNALIRHHDSLRLNYNTKTRSLFYNSAHLQTYNTISEFDLSGLFFDEQLLKIKKIGEEFKGSMDIEKDILFKACIFNLGGDRGKRMLLTAHHLVIDGVSWRIILQDFISAIQALTDGMGIVLPGKTYSYQKWADELERYSKSDAVQSEKQYWDAVIKHDFSFGYNVDDDSDILDNCKTISWVLTEEETLKLLKRSIRAYNTEPVELLIISLVQTIKEYYEHEDIIVEIESHGREELFEDTEISRTVGWFTSFYPVKLRIDNFEISRQIKSLKEQLRGVPNNGINYGVLKYLSGTLNDNSCERIRFNYMGSFEDVLDNELFEFSAEDTGRDVCGNNPITCLMDINALVINKKLQVNMTYSRNRFKEDWMNNFIERYMYRLRVLLQHCCSIESIEFTPSDFETIELSQNDLDGLFN